MKSSQIFAATLAAFGAPVAAFPHLLQEALERELLVKRQTVAPQGAGALPLVPPPFNATAQYVSNTGSHAFVAPSSTDARGMCPGLNAMANHGYIPHNGIATITQFIQGTYEVFGMGADLAAFLAVYGAVVDGTLTSWSIGGLPHTGIGGSHNNYETDSSPLYSDLNQWGTNEKLVLSQFMDLYNRQPDANTANYNLEVLRDFRSDRFQESIAKNPYFVYGAFGGILVSQAAFTFIYRFMSNKSAEYPEGILNKATLKSFFSISGPENNLQWTKGHERIPDNWYKRNDLDQYTIPYFNTDVLYFAETIPEILIPGCNMGTVNSFNDLSVSQLSGAAYTTQSVAQNPLCFATAFAAAEGSAFLGLSASQTSVLTGAIAAAEKALGYSCPAINNANLASLEACPGNTFYGGPTGPVAPDAVQS